MPSSWIALDSRRTSRATDMPSATSNSLLSLVAIPIISTRTRYVAAGIPMNRARPRSSVSVLLTIVPDGSAKRVRAQNSGGGSGGTAQTITVCADAIAGSTKNAAVGEEGTRE